MILTGGGLFEKKISLQESTGGHPPRFALAPPGEAKHQRLAV